MTPDTDEAPGTAEARRGSQVPPRSFDVERGPGEVPSPRPPERSAQPNGTTPMTRALRSNEFWLVLTYFGLLVLVAKGLSS